KVKDFELIGMPLAVVIGNDISEGKVEIIDRESLEKEECSLESLVDTIVGKLA
ncbi:MAG TPA: hypothetical protein EYM49_06875, partial [Campylobacterales bacterium]|nr:hypothetical protein [Campylobacterales bacterium]